MSQTKRGMWVVCALAVGAFAAACAPDDSANDVGVREPAGLDPDQIVYSTNADGTWSADAYLPTLDMTLMSATGTATFTGPSGKTRKMGVCLLQRYASSISPYLPHACTTVSDCTSYPVTLPAGGARYCTAPNDTGTKYCYYRPGSQVDFCAGSPASGGTAVAPGTYSTPEALSILRPGASFISYGCFEGCSATDPSSSSAATVVCKDCGGYCCGGGAM